MNNADRNKCSFQAQYKELKHRNSAPNWLRTIRENGFEKFSAIGFPSKRDEEWRFTDISPVMRKEFKLPSISNKLADLNDVSRFMFTNLDAYRLVFIDGIYSPNLSSVAGLPGAVIIDEISSIANHEDLVKDHLSHYTNGQENAFTALNTAFINHVAVVCIPSNTLLDKPVHLLYINSGSEEDTAIYPRNLIVVGDHSAATIIESYDAVSANCYFDNTVTEIAVGNGSRVEHCKVQRESQRAFHFGTLQVQQKRDSQFTSNSITVGSKLTRNGISTILNDERSECTLNGLYLGANEQIIDNHTRIDHKMPNCNSHELYKGILDGNSSAVFNGKIYVHPDAQKTDAKQTNRVLLLSDNAKINTKPELEIFADDVKCTHGATVGQIDEDALFYLRSRGLDYQKAHSILTYAFAEEALNQLNVTEVRREIDDLLASSF